MSHETPPAARPGMDELRSRVLRFVAERDWERFHSPKNLAMALAVEASELLEVFQWLTEEQSREPAPEVRERAAEEIADVLVYLVQIAHQLGIDPLAAAHAKIAKNALKYPVEKSRGIAKKYDEL